MLHRILALLTMAWLAGAHPVVALDSSGAAEAEKTDKESTHAAEPIAPARLHRLIAQLDSNQFDSREKSQNELARVGKPALEAVATAASTGSLESSTRAINILLTWSESEDHALSIAALERLAKLKGSPRESGAAEELLAQAREGAALEKIVEMGGQYHVDRLVHGRSESLQVIIGSKWTGGLEGLKKLSEVQSATTISFHAVDLGDESLEYLVDVPQLRRLELYGTQVSRDAIERLKDRAPQLQQVEIRSAALLGVQGDHLGNAHVNGIMTGSAADKAGLKVGDIITRLDGDEVKDFKGLTELIALRQPGETVTLTIVRQEKTMELDVTFSKWGSEALKFRGEQQGNVPVRRLQPAPKKILLDRR